MELKFFDPSSRLLRAIADVLDAERAEHDAAPKPLWTTFTSMSGGAPIVSNMTTDTLLKQVADDAAKDNSTRLREDFGGAAIARAAAEIQPKRGRGRPPKQPTVTMPNGVVLNPAEPDEEPEPQDVTIDVVMPPIAVVAMSEPVVMVRPTLDDTVMAYVKAFSVPHAKAILDREGAPKFGVLPDDRKLAVQREMMDAISLGVPVVAV